MPPSSSSRIGGHLPRQRFPPRADVAQRLKHDRFLDDVILFR